MKKLKKVNELYEELDRELGEKLKVIDECMGRGRECPCDLLTCEVDFEKVEVLNREYDDFFEKNDLILKEEKLKKELREIGDKKYKLK